MYTWQQPHAQRPLTLDSITTQWCSIRIAVPALIHLSQLQVIGVLIHPPEEKLTTTVNAHFVLTTLHIALRVLTFLAFIYFSAVCLIERRSQVRWRVLFGKTVMSWVSRCKYMYPYIVCILCCGLMITKSLILCSTLWNMWCECVFVSVFVCVCVCVSVCVCVCVCTFLKSTWWITGSKTQLSQSFVPGPLPSSQGVMLKSGEDLRAGNGTWVCKCTCLCVCVHFCNQSFNSTYSLSLSLSLSLPLPTHCAVDPSLFPPQEITKKPPDTKPSLLSVLLAEYNKKSANPFFEYSKFNGEVSCKSHLSVLMPTPCVTITCTRSKFIIHNHID